MSARYCAASADNNRFPRLIFLATWPMVRCGQYTSLHSLGGKHDETNFLFFISLLASIDAILPAGIALQQIR